jgi:hypothetical protein
VSSETPEARAERITRELREVVSEAAGLLKDLTRVTKEARAQIDTYAGEEIARQLVSLSSQCVEVLQANNDDFIEKWAAAKKAACDEAKAHMEDDWRLAVTVNEVGRHVADALKNAMTHPVDCGCELGFPKEISPAYIRGELPHPPPWH